jgi:hypothetical protein
MKREETVLYRPSDHNTLGPNAVSQIPDDIIPNLKGADPKLLVATKDYECLLCPRQKYQRRHIIRAGEFHYHYHNRQS